MMWRTKTGLLILLLAGPVLGAEDPSQEKPAPTPARQYQALQEEYQAAQEAFQKVIREATTAEERQKVIQEKNPQPEKFAERFFELAEKHPKDAAAVDALVWVVANTYGADKDS